MKLTKLRGSGRTVRRHFIRRSGFLEAHRSSRGMNLKTIWYQYDQPNFYK